MSAANRPAVKAASTSACTAAASGTGQALDGRLGFADLDVRLGSALGHGVVDAMRQVIAQELKGHQLQRLGG